MDAGEHVDELLAGVRPGGCVEAAGRIRVAGDEAVDEAHDVEGGAVDAVVGAQADGRRHGDVGRGQGGDDAVLAAHVVGGGEHLAEGRPAQHPVVAVGVGDPVGEVGAPAGDEVEAERRRDAGHVVLEPPGDVGDVDPGRRLGRGGGGGGGRRSGLGAVGGRRVGHRVFTVERDDRRRRGRRLPPVALGRMPTDVTDATFQTDVLDASTTRPVVVDLWAPWCGPCRTLGPILEQVVDETAGPGRAGQGQRRREPPGRRRRSGCRASRRSSPWRTARWSTGSSAPCPSPRCASSCPACCRARRSASSRPWSPRATRQSLRQALELEPDHAGAIVALAELLAERRQNGDVDEALALIARIPETAGDPPGGGPGPHGRRGVRGDRRGHHVQAGDPPRPGEDRRRRPPAVSSTCSSSSAPTTPARPTTAAA